MRLVGARSVGEGVSVPTRALFGIALGAIFAVSFASVALFQGRADSTARVQHTLRVVGELDAFLSALRDAETGQRGFLLTTRDSYLEPYRAGAREAPTRLEAVKRALAGDTSMQARLGRLEQIMRAKLEELESTVRAAQEGKTGVALIVVSSDRGKSLMEEARGLVAEMVTAQQQALVSLETQQRRFDVALVGTALGGGGLLAALTVLTFIGARRDLRNAERVAEERARTHDYQQRAISILSHDIRSPLTAAQLSAERLTHGVELPPDSIARRSAEVVRRSTQRAMRIVNSLLDLTHLRLGDGLPLSPEPADLVTVTRSVVDEANAEGRGRVELEALGSGDGVFDEVRIGQALANLVANALKYGRPGAPVQVRVDARGDDTLKLEVHNEGEPIPPELVPRLFDPFHRGETKLGARESLGLGLYIVREIARAHGGQISVSSTQRDGTRFTLVFPRGIPGPVVPASGASVAAAMPGQTDDPRPAAPGRAEDIVLPGEGRGAPRSPAGA